MAHSHIPTCNIAVIGCGYWGKNLVRVFSELGALVAICDSDNDRASQFAQAYKIQDRSWDDVLSDKTIDAVSIATPATTHAELVLEALKSGKHVLVEKPMALDVKQAEMIIKNARTHNRTVMVGHLLQYHPAFCALQHLVTEGRLGKLRYIYSHRLNLGRFRTEENILWSFAPHDISMILSLTGSEPEHVSAVGQSYLGQGIADTTVTHLSFSAGVRAHIYVSWLHPFKEQKLVAIGDKGMAVFDDTQDWDLKLRLYPHVVKQTGGVAVARPADAMDVAVESREPLREECLHFLNCVERGITPRTEAEEGLRVLRVLTTAQQALTASLKAPGNEKQNAMIHESSYIDPNTSIGTNTRIWHFCHILVDTRIGNNCTIGQNVMIGPGVTVGNGCRIQNNVSVYKGVTLEDNVFVGPSAVFTNVNTPRADINRMEELATTHVCRGATIGANATIVCGTNIGAYAFIAAGAVITKDVPAHALVAGIPALQIGWVGHAGERLLEERGQSQFVCPRTGRRYTLVDSVTLSEINK